MKYATIQCYIVKRTRPPCRDLLFLLGIVLHLACYVYIDSSIHCVTIVRYTVCFHSLRLLQAIPFFQERCTGYFSTAFNVHRNKFTCKTGVTPFLKRNVTAETHNTIYEKITLPQNFIYTGSTALNKLVLYLSLLRNSKSHHQGKVVKPI